VTAAFNNTDAHNTGMLTGRSNLLAFLSRVAFDVMSNKSP